MSEIEEMLERQARWQKTRQALSWPEKIQMAERIRESARHLRTSWKAGRTSISDAGIQDQAQRLTATRPRRP
jgi:hypothetical protein